MLSDRKNHNRRKSLSGVAWLHQLPRRTAFSWPVFVLLMLLALGLNLLYLGRPSLWFDEAFSVELSRQPLPLLWRTIFGPEPNMELYYLLLHFWLQVTGWLGLPAVEWVVRLPSAVCAALSAGVLFLLARRYVGTLVAAAATLLYASNYLQLVYAQQTRAYALQLLLLCLSWFALLTALQCQTQQKRWWVGYVIVTVLAVYTHLFSLFIIFAQCVALGGLLFMPTQWRSKVHARVRMFAVSLLAIGLLSIPMFLESLHGSKTGWLFVPHLRELQSLFTIISGSNTRYLWVVVGCIGLGIVAVGMTTIIGQVPSWYRWASTQTSIRQEVETLPQLWPLVWILLCWFLLPIVSSYVVSQGSLRLFSTRYLVVVVPPFCLLAALSLSIWRWRLVQGLVLCVLLGSALLVVPHYYQHAQVEEWNTSVHWLLARSQPGDGLVCYDNATTQGCQIAVEYYLHAYPNGTHFSADAPGAFSWERFSRDERQQDPALAIEPQALTMYAQQHSRIFMITGRLANATDANRAQKTQQWLDQHYHFVDQIVTRTVTIRLYATR